MIGFIGRREVEEILRGNHMINISSVQRKADTVMRQIPGGSNGKLTMNEFVNICKKFPNILIPTVGVQAPEIKKQKNTMSNIIKIKKPVIG